MSQLALVVIARNESRCIQRCLSSARSLVDRMVVLDTGSNDDTIQLAQAGGAQVHQMKWPNDFSVARNKCLELADADWNLVLDADEWIDASVPPRVVRSFLDGPRRLGLVKIRSSFEVQRRIEHSDCWTPRLLPKGVQYGGRIHEQPISKLPDERLDVLIHHDGYQPEISRGKRQRNQQLLVAELIKHPQSAYLHYQLGVEHDCQQEWGLACSYFDKAIELGACEQPFSHDLAGRHLHAMARLSRWPEALSLAMELEQRWPDSSDIFFSIGNLYLDLACAEPARALDTWLPAAETAWQNCLAIGEHDRHANHVLGRGSFLAAHNLAIICEGMQQSDRARAYAALAESSRMLTANATRPAHQSVASCLK